MRSRSEGFISRSTGFMLVAIAFLLSGCMAKSVAPVVLDRDAELDPALLGHWRSADDKGSVEITARGRLYLLEYADKDEQPAHLVGRLGRLGARRVLDISPDPAALKDDPYSALVLPLHIVLFVDSIGTEVRVRSVNSDSLDAYVTQHPSAVAHLTMDDDVVLTAPTEELRAFLERFAARPGVLDSATWVRR